jgi:hypothetical protein
MNNSEKNSSLTVTCHGGCGRTFTAPARKIKHAKYYLCNSPESGKACKATLPPCPEGKERRFISKYGKRYGSTFVLVFDNSFKAAAKSNKLPKETHYKGDAIYSIDATHDLRVGDEIRFMRAQYKGEYPKSYFIGFMPFDGKIASFSYNPKNTEHTVFLLLADGKKTRIQAHNLFNDLVFRKPWKDESLRANAQEIQINPGDRAFYVRNFAGLSEIEAAQQSLWYMKDGLNWDGSPKTDEGDANGGDEDED